jgi:anti-anti-sigma factor
VGGLPDELFRAVAEAAPALIWMADPSGACTYFNRAWLEFRGRRVEQELGDGWAEGVHPDDVEGCVATYRDALAKRISFEMEYRLRRHDGAYRWMIDRGSPMYEGGGFTGMVGICVDIHERRLERERGGLVADLVAALDEAEGDGQRLEALARLLAERVGDLCTIEMADDAGRLIRAAAAASDPELERLVRELRLRSPLPADDPRGMSGVSRTGRPSLVEEVTPEMIDAYVEVAGVGPADVETLRRRPPRSVIVAPLRARGRTLGAILLATYGARRLDEEKLALVEEAADRAAQSLDTGRLLRTAGETAERLRGLQEATAALSSASTPEAVAQAAVGHLRGLLEAMSTTMYEVADGDLRVLARDAPGVERLSGWDRVSLEVRSAITDAARERRAIWIEGLAGWRERYPQHAEEAEARGFLAAVSLPLAAGGEVIGAIGLAFGTERHFDAADREAAAVLSEAAGQALARARLQRQAEVERLRAELLAEVSFALDSESGVEERLGRLAELLTDRVADLVTVRIADGSDRPPRLAAVVHRDPGAQELARTLYTREAAPDPGPARVMATGRPELVADAVTKGPDAADQELAERLRRLEVISYMSLPLTARGAILGALTVMTTTHSARRYGEPDLVLAGEVARRAALTIDNARTFEAEQAARDAAERARGRTERLQRVTAALAAALTEEEVARAVVREAMQALQAVAGTVLVRQGDQARVLVAAGYPADILHPGQSFPVEGPFPLSLVLRTGEELWLEEAGDWGRRFGTPSGALRAAGIGLPLRVGGEIVGAIGFRFGQDSRSFSAADRALALAMAGQCALAFERVRLYETERHAAAVLQRALLPAGLPRTGSARLDVRYLPAAGLRSGGDFYDAVELPDGRLSLVVGDVVGHGVEAAAVMGQLRSAWRASALEGAGPGATVRRLSRFAERVEGASVATVACAVLAGGEMRYATAGHPPPLLRRPDGGTEYLMDGRGPPLAVTDDAYPEASVLLEPGSLVLLYTDGAIERDRDLGRGMDELAELVAGGDAEPEHLLARLASAVGTEPDDDCAFLALRVPDATPSLRLTIPARPSAVRGARATTRRWLLDARVGERDADDVVLAASEALANSVEHAYADRPPGHRAVIELEITRDGPEELSIVVRDRGAWRPPGDGGTGRGRGLLLMRALMESVGIEPGEGGTTVRMRRRLASATDAPPAPEAVAAEPHAEDPPVPGEPVGVDGDLDEAAAPALASQLRAIAAERGGAMRLDLTEVRHIGSAGVRMLVELDADLRRAGGRLEVMAPPGTIARRVIELTRVGIRLAPDAPA